MADISLVQELRHEPTARPMQLTQPNEQRESAAFTPDVMRVANILTLKEGTFPVGSFKFKV